MNMQFGENIDIVDNSIKDNESQSGFGESKEDIRDVDIVDSVQETEDEKDDFVELHISAVLFIVCIVMPILIISVFGGITGDNSTDTNHSTDDQVVTEIEVEEAI